MLYLLQIIKMLDKKQTELFINLMDDLSFEIDDMGYKGMESELVNEMMDNHLGIFIESESQLNMFTEYILKNQNNMENVVKRARVFLDMN